MKNFHMNLLRLSAVTLLVLSTTSCVPIDGGYGYDDGGVDYGNAYYEPSYDVGFFGGGDWVAPYRDSHHRYDYHDNHNGGWSGGRGNLNGGHGYRASASHSVPSIASRPHSSGGGNFSSSGGHGSGRH